MVDRAVAELQVDLRRAYVVGDHASDIQLAKSAGMKSVLVTSGNVDQQALTMLRAAGALPDMVAPSMAEAAECIFHDVAARASKVAAANTGER
jgi:heptosyltransferase-2